MKSASLGVWVGLVVLGACSSKGARGIDASSASHDAAAVDAKQAQSDEPKKRLLVLTEADWTDLDGWENDNQLEALGALRRSCRALMGKKADSLVGKHHIAGTVADWKPLCKAAKDPKTTAAARAFFEEHFVPRAAANNDDRIGRFTGYYNATIRASRKKRGKYKIPMWGRPTDLISADLSKWSSNFRGERVWGKIVGKRMVPYETRKEIGRGAIRKRAKVVFWADDPIDVFFAQVQGSASVTLDDGSTTRVGVAGKNGRIYTAIGRVLIADGELTRKTVSMQSIRQWMLDNPTEAKGLMEKNEAYVFFRELDGDGPRGAQGVVLTPGRSLAVDLRWLPMPVPLWVETEVPTVGEEAVEPYRRLMIAQDTGGAIRGPVRGDIYFGHDESAFDQAGRMKGMGSYYVLLPKTVANATANEASER